MKGISIVIICCHCLFITVLVKATTEIEAKYSIYIDADFSEAITSSQSIKQGINTALAEIGYQVQGTRFDIF